MMKKRAVQKIIFCLMVAWICGNASGQLYAGTIEPQVINKGNFQFNVYKKNEPVAAALVKDIKTIDQQVRSYYDMKELNDIQITIDLVDSDSESAVVEKDYTDLPAWVAAYALPFQKRIIIRYKNVGSYPYSGLQSVVKHELSHMYLWHICILNRVTVPKWFDEGLAMYIERKWNIEDYYQVAIGVIRTHPIPIRNLTNYFPQDEYDVKIAYAESFSLVSYMVDSYGEHFLLEILSQISRGVDFERAVKSLTGKTIDEIEQNWQTDIFRYYRWIPIIASTGFLWIILTLLTSWLYWRRRKKNQLIMEQWEQDEKKYDA